MFVNTIFRISITGAASVEIEDESDASDIFKKDDFMGSPLPSTEETTTSKERELLKDEGFSEEENVMEADEVDQGERMEKKPILMVNVENILDGKYTQDQELKVYSCVLIFHQISYLLSKILKGLIYTVLHFIYTMRPF